MLCCGMFIFLCFANDFCIIIFSQSWETINLCTVKEKASRKVAHEPTSFTQKTVKLICKEKLTEGVSTSAKKLKICEGDYDIHIEKSFGYRFVNFITVFSVISELVVCKKCGSNIKFHEASNRDLGFKIVVACDKCQPSFINASPLIDNHTYEINRRIIFAMRLLGIGLHGLTKFCAIMDLPRPIFHSCYDTNSFFVRTISVATAAVREKCTKKAAAKEKERSIEQGQTNGITVSGDGTWRRVDFRRCMG